MMLIKFQMMKIAVVKRFQEGRKYVGTTIEGTASMEMQNVDTSILRQSAKNILVSLSHKPSLNLSSSWG